MTLQAQEPGRAGSSTRHSCVVFSITNHRQNVLGRQGGVWCEANTEVKQNLPAVPPIHVDSAAPPAQSCDFCGQVQESRAARSRVEGEVCSQGEMGVHYCTALGCNAIHCV